MCVNLIQKKQFCTLISAVSSDNGTVTFMFASGGQDDLIKLWNFQAVLGSAGTNKFKDSFLFAII